MRKRNKSPRKLSFFKALFPYLGGKRRLCPLIFREIHRLVPRHLWPGLTFLDGFLGGGSVSLYAKAMGFRVVACDIADRAITVGQALIENSRTRLTREDVLRLLEPIDGHEGPIERDMVPSVFTKNIGRFLDRALAMAGNTQDPAKAALIRMLAIRLAMLEHPMSQIRKGTVHRVTTGEYENITESCVHHYVDGLRLTRFERVWALAQEINGGVFMGEGRVIKQNVLEALPAIQADVAYFDPPYPGVMSYEKEYQVIDRILEGESKPTSPFTAADGAKMIDGLFERAGHIPIWLLSLGNAVVGISELEEKMSRLGRATRAIEIEYQHLPAIATDEKKEQNREFLVVGWDPASDLLCSVDRIGVRDQVAKRNFTNVTADIHTDPDGRSTKSPPTSSLREDALQQGQPSLSKQIVSRLGIEPLPEPQCRVDPPDAICNEVALDVDGEVEMFPGKRHEPSVARTGTQIKSEE